MLRYLHTAAVLGSLLLGSPLHAITLGFEDLSLGNSGDGSTPYNSTGTYFWNGSNNAGGFSTGGATFHNAYTDYGGGAYSWDGFSYSNTTDASTPGFLNQYSAYPGSGSGGSSHYVVGYQPFSGEWAINFSAPQNFNSLTVDITNTTYTARTILDGDGFTNPFTDGDWFLLTLTGWNGASTTGSLDFYLADYRAGLTNVVSAWTSVDLSALGSGVDKITFALTSSDVGMFGINTPTYFALDNLQVSNVPEPSTYLLVVFGLSLLVLARHKWVRS